MHSSLSRSYITISTFPHHLLPPSPPAHASRSKSRPLPAISPPSTIHPRVRHPSVPAHVWRCTSVWWVRGVASAAAAAASGVAVSGVAAAAWISAAWVAAAAAARTVRAGHLVVDC